MRFRVAFVFAALVFATFGPRTVSAAPQVLAVFETDGIPFTCSDGLCTAELSTYCLQRKRPEPGFGTAYTPAVGEDFALLVTRSGGDKISLPAGEHVTFTTYRGFTAATVEIAEADLQRLGGTEARIQVAPMASLLPVPVSGDLLPLTEKEIAYATGSLRAQGGNVVDHGAKAGAARIIATVRRSLPTKGAVPAGGFKQAWDQALGTITNGPGLDRAEAAYDRCSNAAHTYAFGGLRRCLEYRHDEIIRDLNGDYWNSLIGS